MTAPKAKQEVTVMSMPPINTLQEPKTGETTEAMKYAIIGGIAIAGAVVVFLAVSRLRS
jgi:LPXTG-motif cell wall-anchored protein